MEKQTIYKVSGSRIYDPRIDRWIISDNPALIFGDLVRKNEINTKYSEIEEKKFWQLIANWANYCDKTLSRLD
jgi:hypothetical protein